MPVDSSPRRLEQSLRLVRTLGFVGLAVQCGTAALRLLPLPPGALLGLFTTAHLQGGLIALPFILWLSAHAWLRALRGEPLARTRVGALLQVLLVLNLALPLVRIGLYAAQGLVVPQSDASRGVVAVSYLLHIGTGYLILGVGGLFVGHLLVQAGRRGRPQLLDLARRVGRSAGWTLGFCAVFSILYFGARADERRALAQAQAARAPFASAPARSSTADGHTWPLATPLADARSCGSAECHANIFQQWAGTPHARSASDPAYVRVLDAFVADEGVEASAFCAGCHDPMHLLSGDLAATGAARGPLSDGGVGCLFCHRATPSDPDSPGNGSWMFSPPPLFPWEVQAAADIAEAGQTVPRHAVLDTEGLSFAAHITQPYVYSNLRAHAAAYRMESLGDSALCGSCHEGSLPAGLPVSGTVHTTFSEWRDGPHSAGQDRTTCVDCHMPQDAAGDLPLHDADTEDGAPVRSHRLHGANSALASLEAREGWTEPLARIAAGRSLSLDLAATHNPEGLVEVTIGLTNAESGHAIPSGAVDLKALALRVTLGDATHTLPILARPLVDADGRREDHAIWIAHKEGPPGLAPKERRTWTVELPAPALGSWPVRAVLVRRAWTEGFAAYVGLEAPTLELGEATTTVTITGP